MRNVRQLLESKPAEVHSIAPGAPVIEALRLMADKRIGAVLVLEDGHLAGILSERDYARKIALLGRSSADTPVRDIMTSELRTVAPDDSIEHCMQVVTDSRIRHLPVLERGELVGLLSSGALVTATIEDQQIQLDHLQRYIAS
jgi:CBS domain-containing protein